MYWKLLRFHATLIVAHRRKLLQKFETDGYDEKDAFDTLCLEVLRTGEPADFKVFIQRAEGILLPQKLQEAFDSGRLRFMW